MNIQESKADLVMHLPRVVLRAATVTAKLEDDGTMAPGFAAFECEAPESK